jgi:hypothetical protein
MERLRAFYKRQVISLLMLAHDCADTKTQKC